MSRAGLLPGLAALLAIAAVVGTSLFGLAGHASGDALSAVLGDPYVARVAVFTVLQATLSVVLSVLLALPVAQAAHRHADRLLVRLFLSLGNLAFVTPVIIGVFGVVQLHGRSGWTNEVAELVGLAPGAYVYGLTGILIAHVFFNMPFAARNMAAALGGVPAENWRLAAQLGMGPVHIFRFVEWPALRAVLFPTAAVIFALCFTSFAVVLTLGGGPRATILEVAIYQALRFEFDIDRAVALSGVQIVLAGTLAVALAALARSQPREPALGIAFLRPDRGSAFARLVDALAVLIAAAAVLGPLAGIAVPALASLTPERLADPFLWRAAGWSLMIALGAGGLALLLGLGLLLTVRELGPRRGHWHVAAGLEGAGAIILVTPPVLLGAGLFLALRAHIDVLASAAPLVIAVNAVATLPFVLRVLGPVVRGTVADHDRLCASLGIAGLDRWRIVDWPTIRGPAGTALGIAAAMAAGELGVIALFGSPHTTTLPLLIYQRMGAYRMAEAATGVAVLMVLALALLVVLERALAGRRGHA